MYIHISMYLTSSHQRLYSIYTQTFCPLIIGGLLNMHSDFCVCGVPLCCLTCIHTIVCQSPNRGSRFGGPGQKALQTIIIIIIIIQKICSMHISTLLGAQGVNPETPGQAISVLGSFTCITQHTGLQLDVPSDGRSNKCLAQGHKCRQRPGWYSNPHSDNTSTWVQCSRPLVHDTSQWTSFCWFLPRPVPLTYQPRNFKDGFISIVTMSLISLRYTICLTGRWSIIGRCVGDCQQSSCAEERLLMARNVFKFFTENNPTRGHRKK